MRIDSNPELFPEHHPLPPLSAVALPAIHDHDDTTPLVIVVTLLLLLGLFYQCAMIVCMCDTIQGEHLFCCSSSVALFLIASLSRGVHSIMQRRRRSRASVLVCACLFACGHRCADVCVCVCSDRKITTERCSTSNPLCFVFTLFNFAHTPIFRTVLARSPIRRRSSSTCGFFLVPSLGSLASHAHCLSPRCAAAVLACGCVLSVPFLLPNSM